MIYRSYASVYDRSGHLRFSVLMAYYLRELCQRHPVVGEYALDIACGTGMLALLLAEEGWQVVGLDASPAMLDRARARVAAAGRAEQIELHEGDMRALAHRLPPARYHLATCTYDSLNYLLREEELAACFAGVATVLAPGGLFVGDMNTRHFLEYDWGTCSILEQPGYIQVGQSRFDPQQATSVLALTGLVGDDQQGYVRFDEEHIERAYPPAQITALLTAAGLVVEATYDSFSFNPPDAKTQRIVWVARKPETETYETCRGHYNWRNDCDEAGADGRRGGPLAQGR